MDCETAHFQIIHTRSPREHQRHILATSRKTTVLILILLHSVADFRFPAPGAWNRKRQRSIVLSFLSSEERKWPEEEGGNKRSKEPFGREELEKHRREPYSLRGISNLSTYRGRARLQQAPSEAPFFGIFSLPSFPFPLQTAEGRDQEFDSHFPDVARNQLSAPSHRERAATSQAHSHLPTIEGKSGRPRRPWQASNPLRDGTRI